jgi:O-antigen/teichoic acid export membrane protein
MVTNNKNFIKTKDFQRGYLTLLDQGITSFSNFLTGVIIARSCTKEEFGIYAVAFSIVIIMVEIQTRLISNPYMVYIKSNIVGSKNKYSGSTLLHQLVFSVVITGLFLIILRLFLNFQNNNKEIISDSLLAFSIAALFILLKEFGRRIYLALLEPKRAIVIDGLAFFIQIAGLLILGKLGILSIKMAFVIIGISSALVTIIWFLSFYHQFSISLNRAISDLKLNWEFGKWLFIAGAAAALSSRAYIWMLTAFRGPAEVAVLAACLGVILLANPVLLGLENYFGPQLIQTYINKGILRLRLVIERYSIWIGFIMLFYCSVIFLFGENILILIYGDKYSGFKLILFILSIKVFFLAITLPAGSSFYAFRKPKVHTKISIFSLVSTCTFGFFLVKQIGILGAALGLVFSDLIASLARYFYYRNIIKPLLAIGE